MSDLHLVVNLVKYFGNLNEAKDGNQMSDEFQAPDFYWVLRDFFHNIDEFESTDSYMEDCLKPDLDSVSAESLKKNQVRKLITNFFKRRRCFTMVRPVEDADQLANIDDLSWESPDIKETFKYVVNDFVENLKDTCRVKQIGGKSFNGQMLVGLAMDFCEAVNAEDTPKIQSSV